MISLCICTMNRPDELEQCLESVFQAAEPPEEVLVSDDSPNGEPTQAVVSKYPGATYQVGPRRGLGPNRNACIQMIKFDSIIFIDDDVRVPSDFFAIARKLISEVDERVIITGYEMNHRENQVHKVVPHNADFLGLQRVPVTDEYRSIVINSTIFPAGLFKQIKFDEQLRYGCDEIDVARHAISLDYRIVYCDILYVNHYPSPVNREQYQQFIHASRFYTTAKAYWQYESSFIKVFAYIFIAPLQLIGSSIRRGNIKQLLQIPQIIILATTYFLRHLEASKSNMST
jgi:glycosyltransferase involved in cell wall biosynthesis